MKLRFGWKIICGLMLVLGLSISVSWASSLRITMTDNNTVEVPYYWEEGGEIRFEVPGGVAGVPKNQVKSIQEIVTSREFDPEVLVESPRSSSSQTQREALHDLVASKSPVASYGKKMETEEGLKLLKEEEASSADSKFAGERVYAPMSRLEGDFAELVRPDGRDVVLVMQNILSSRTDLENRRFTLSLYDANGKIILQKPCELIPLDVDNKTLRALNLRGHLYSLVASVKPDPKIKRFEITVSQK